MKKLKLNIQFFASTNKTSHYNLSQYLGSDKPTYLTDYNTDMNNIDTGIYNAQSKANSNETNIGDLTLLETTNKTDLVSAVNEIKGQNDTNTSNIANNTTDIATNTSAIGTLANLETTAKNNLVSAINENTENISKNTENINKFNFTNFDTYNPSDFTSTGDVSSIVGNLNVATNSDGSIFKVYTDSLLISLSGYNQSSISVQTRIRPTSSLNIVGSGTLIDEDTNRNFVWIRGANFSLNTSGLLTISFAKDFTNGDYKFFIFNPCIYFAKDFGDSPSPVNPN